MSRTARLEDVTSQRDALEKIGELIRKGSIDQEVLRAAKAVTRDCSARDDLCELEAIFNAVKHGDSRVAWLKKGLRYVADPYPFDTFHSASAMIESCRAGACSGDCLPLDTLVLRRDYRLIALDETKIGDVIWNGDRWTTISNRWDKGEKDLIAIRLNNGSILRVTEDHKLFRVTKVNENGHCTPSADLAGPRESAEEVRAGEVRLGDDLLTGGTIPCGPESMTTDLAWLLGVYIADGWSEEHDGQPWRASISGKDGHPKEEQKRRVKEIAGHQGWETRWHERYIAINDRHAAAWLSATGKRAPSKHIPSGLNYNEATIRVLLDGLRADATLRDDGTVTHGTTSALLAVQLRILYRMLGQSSSLRRVDDHGGLGSNPIYRITPRKNDRADGKKAKIHARVKAIEELESAPVMDIETDTGRFYLPETDLVVHNCDDATILVASLAASIGFMVGARAWGKGTSGDLLHVYPVAAVPKSGPWPREYLGHGLDITVPQSEVGWEPEGGHFITAWVNG